MASFQPTEEDVETFLSMVPDLSRAQVIARLKGNNNNVDQAVNEYFDNLGGPNKYEWDEGAFQADRNGLSNTHGPEFNVQSADDTGPFGGRFDGGLSRPPSRISNTRFPADTSTYDEGDRDLHEALAASRAEAGLPPQDTGVISTDQPFFGPANRSQYEPGKWDLVPTGRTYAQEILLDPEPAERKREPDAPAFLKPSVEDHRLGALLTIYHEIPIVREIFLDRKNVVSNYGSGNEWWTGKAIELPTMNGPADPGSELRQEMQRLMAFLDKTDRSYGSADALANLPAVKEQQRHAFGDGVEVAVLKAYRELLEDSDSVGAIKKLFSIGVDGPQQTNFEEFAILRLDLPPKNSELETIYDIADATLWNLGPLEPLELSNSPYLSHIADVIVFQLDGDSSSKGVEVPAVWYPDRYLESGRQAALDMRLRKSDIKEALRRIEIMEESLTNYTIPGKKTVKVQDLFRATLQHDAEEIKDDAGLDQTGDNLEGIPSTQKSPMTKNLSSEIRKLMKSIDRKLLSLNEEKEKARDALRQLSKLYTQPSDDPTQPPLHKYTLRGVSTSKSTMYICTQAESNLIDLDIKGDDSRPKGDQWWRISYASSGTNPITVEKTTEETVLEAARTYKSEDKFSLLVYASDKAMSWERQPLPKALETFVRYDNALFRSEFPNEVTSPKSPGKRKFDSSSDESSESAKWSGGVSVKGGENGVNVIEREIGGSEPEDGGAHANRNERHEVFIGVDPSTHAKAEGSSARQEMQERGSMRMLSGRIIGSAENATTVDSMDLDPVVEDDHVAEESGAVKHAGSSA